MEASEKELDRQYLANKTNTLMNDYMRKSSASSSRSPFRNRNVSQEQYDIVNNTNESVADKNEKHRAEVATAEGTENLLSTVTRGIAITPEGFNSNRKHKKTGLSSNKKGKQAAKSSNKKKKSDENKR